LSQRNIFGKTRKDQRRGPWATEVYCSETRFDRTNDRQVPIKDLWRNELQFEDYFAALSPCLALTLDTYMQFPYMLHLVDGTIVKDKENIQSKATYILHVSLLDIQLSQEDPLLVAAAAYYTALLTIGIVPLVSSRSLSYKN
jgi:hypothetical protein